MDEEFLEVKEAESIISAPRVVAPTWTFEQMNFAVGNLGSVVRSDFYIKIEKLDVQERNKNRVFADRVIQVCEAHDRVIASFL